MTYQIPVFVNGARGSAAFFFVVLNPIKYVDPDGRDIENNTDDYILAKYEHDEKGFVVVPPHTKVEGKFDGVLTNNGQVFKISDTDDILPEINVDLQINKEDGKYSAALTNTSGALKNTGGDIAKSVSRDRRGRSGEYFFDFENPNNPSNSDQTSGWGEHAIIRGFGDPSQCASKIIDGNPTMRPISSYRYLDYKPLRGIKVR